MKRNKKRKGVLVLSIILIIFVLTAIGCFVADTLMSDDGFMVIFQTYNQMFITFLTGFNFSGDYMIPTILVLAGVGITALNVVISLIVDLIRRRHIVWLFVVLYLLTGYVFALMVFPLYLVIYNLIASGVFTFSVGLVAVGASALALFFMMILFIVDMATGKRAKRVTYTDEYEDNEYYEDDSEEYYEEEEEEEPEEVFEYERDLDEEDSVEEAPAPKKEAVVMPVLAQEAAPAEEVEEAKPAPKKAPAKPAAKKPAPKKEEAKPEVKPAPKKEEAKKPAPKAAPAKKPAAKKEEKAEQPLVKAYHVSRRPELNKWQVKAAGSDKAIKLFNTQKEAIEFANQLADNQEAAVRVHSKEGKLRKQ